ncbi:hypothetical protein EVAR_34525_1 [Eumeta japonica]|uniref:Uncharacterized protein n=1 Tax=Eumeta variegata TaxID=151549 RepID=A0A4C1Z294_EUMVA|nr:hypothetical protein EVAR_34525_1 [Eumeta japonica]
MNTGHEDTHRYVPTGVHGKDSRWLQPNFFNFADKTRRLPHRPRKSIFFDRFYFVYAEPSAMYHRSFRHFVAHAP